MGGNKGVPSALYIFGQAPPCTKTGISIGVGFGTGAGISSIGVDCIVTDFGVICALGVGLAGVLNMGFLGVFAGEDFPVTLGNLDFD